MYELNFKHVNYFIVLYITVNEQPSYLNFRHYPLGCLYYQNLYAKAFFQ